MGKIISRSTVVEAKGVTTNSKLPPGQAKKNPSPIPSPTPTPITSSNFKFGVVVDDYSNNSGTLTWIQQQLGRPVNTISIFKQFGSPTNNLLIPSDLTYAKSQGIKVQLAWEPWNPDQGINQSVDYLADIPTGKDDSYLSNMASAIKNYGGPVVLRFGHEMNGNWYPWGDRPAEYIKAYRYIVTYFRNTGVSNITWMWCINADNVPYSAMSNAAQFYPGDDVVDSVGVDGFNFGSTSGWRSFTSIFSPAYNFLFSTYHKPIVIAETASSELGGDKAAWVQSMFKTELPTYFPAVNELVWFDLNKETDWRIDSSASSLQSFVTSIPK